MTVFLLLLLAFGPLVVLANSFKLSIETIQQCEPVSVAFSDKEESDAIPTSLTLLPFNSSVVSIALPSDAANATGLSISFFPLAAGIDFIASLDDAEGDSVAQVSDVLQVTASPTDDSSCLPPAAAGTFFRMPTTVSQCGAFSIRYSGSNAPTVRVVQPLKDSRLAALISDNSDAKIANYLMPTDHGEEVIIYAFDQAMGRGQTSALLTVEGTNSSPTSCQPEGDDDEEDANLGATAAVAPGRLPNSVIIGLSVAGGVILLFGVIMTAYFLRSRQRKRAQREPPVESVSLQPPFMNFDNYSRATSMHSVSKRGTPVPPPLNLDNTEQVQNPAYATQVYSPTIASGILPASTPSYSFRVSGMSGDLRSSQNPGYKHTSIASALTGGRGRRDSANNNTLQYTDIEDMLIAASHNDRQGELSSVQPPFERTSTDRNGSLELVAPPRLRVIDENARAHQNTASIASSEELYHDLFTRPSRTPTPQPTDKPTGVDPSGRF